MSHAGVGQAFPNQFPGDSRPATVDSLLAHLWQSNHGQANSIVMAATLCGGSVTARFTFPCSCVQGCASFRRVEAVSSCSTCNALKSSQLLCQNIPFSTTGY